MVELVLIYVLLTEYNKFRYVPPSVPSKQDPGEFCERVNQWILFFDYTTHEDKRTV